MPTVLLEHQHELTTEDQSLSLVFGTTTDGYLTTTFPVISGGDDQSADVARVREDGMSLGEDYTGSKTVAFEISVLTDKDANPLSAGSDKLNAFERVWKHRKLRNSSSAYAILRSKVGGRTRRAYGRPRRYDEPGGTLVTKGITPLVCDFFVPDGTWYDDVSETATVRIIQSTESGLVAPLVTPLTTTTDPDSLGYMIVGGDKATWPVIKFYGPILNPKLTLTGTDSGIVYSVGLNYFLGQTNGGDSVTIDSRPWMRTVTLSSTKASVGGLLTYYTPRMADLLLEPDRYNLTFTGTDVTGNSKVEVSWRNAYSRW